MKKDTASTSSTEIPFARRRLLPDQLSSLQALFAVKTHPSKEDRIALASELGLEIKAVNVWYQNKRRSAKKQALAWKPPNYNSSSADQNKDSSYLRKLRRRPLTRTDSTISLESIASSRERRDSAASSSNRPPLSLKSNQSSSSLRFQTPPPKRDLWEHIPSSPQAPPSSPSADSRMLSLLPPECKTMRSLEWACAKARANRSKACLPDEDEILSSSLVASVSPEEDMLVADSDDTEDDMDELITPDSSLQMIVNVVSPPKARYTYGKRSRRDSNDSPFFEKDTVAAAMTLLDFKVRKDDRD